MEYYVRGRAYGILPDGFTVDDLDDASGIPCRTIVEASSEKEASEKGLKKLEKRMGMAIKVLEALKIGKNPKDYPYFVD